MNITSGDIINKVDSKASISGSEASASFAATGSQAFNSASLAGFKLPLQTQVVLDSNGMALKKDDGTTLADYGIVTELFKNGATDDKAILGGDGLAVVKSGVTSSLFGVAVELRSGVIASKNTASFDANGFTIVKGGVTQSRFGADAIVGKNATDKTALRITNAGALSIGTSNTTNFSVAANGNVTMTGTMNISNPGDIDIADLDNSTAGFTDNTLATTANNAASNAQSAVDTIEEKVVITGAAVQVQNSTADKTIIDSGIVSIVQGNVTSSLFTSTNSEIRGGTLASKTTASFDAVGVRFIEGGVTQSIFGSNVTQIGVTTGSHFEVSGSGLRLKDGNVPRFAVDGNGLKVGNTSTSGFATQSFVDIDTFGVNIVKDGNSVGLFGGNSVRIGNTAISQSQIDVNSSGDSPGTTFKDADGNIVATIGTAVETSGGTFGGGSRVIPQAGAIRGMIVENIATNQAIVTGSISGSNLIAREINITGSANVGGLVTSGSVRNTSTGAATLALIHAHDGSNTLFQVKTNGEVLAKDNITAFTTGFTSISDKRLKTDVYPISQSLDKILKLAPSGFTWIEKQEKDIGFIAQDVEKIIPELVHETKGFEDINSDKQDDTIYKSISYDKLTIYLVDAIKELTKRVEELEKENKILRVD